ncbi:MAG: magnesium transporter [Bacteroidota bacterium]
MVLELNKENIDRVKDAIANGNDRFLEDTFADAHAADVVEFIEHLTNREAQYLLKTFAEENLADILIELDEDTREQVLASFTSREIAEIIDNVDSDDAADVLSELSDSKKEEVISFLEDAGQASDIVDLLNYEEGTAGSLMATELIKVNLNWQVTHAIREMRKQADDVGDVYTIYVVDDQDKLVGTLSLKKLLFSTSLRSTIADIYNNRKVRYTYAQDHAEDAIEIMKKYDLVVLPVVDESQRLLGRITIDDAVDVMQEESDKDYQMAAGISGSVESSDSVWILSRARLPWLLIGLVGGLLSAQVIGMYETELQINPKLAIFMPLIAAMGGNAGVQSSAIVVQGLANNTVSLEGILPRLLKELVVAMMNASICAIAIVLYNYFADNGFELGLTVGVSMVSVIIFASLIGTFIPLVLDKFNVDPALATGPFITTTNDILGLTIYFTVGHLMYGF